MDKFEYKFFKMDFALWVKIDKKEEELNALGQEGWEVVNFEYPKMATMVFLLKRKLNTASIT